MKINNKTKNSLRHLNMHVKREKGNVLSYGKMINSNIPKEVSFSGNSENLEELIGLIKNVKN